MPYLPPRSAEKYIYIVNEIVNARAHWIKTRAHEWSVGVCIGMNRPLQISQAALVFGDSLDRSLERLEFDFEVVP